MANELEHLDQSGLTVYAKPLPIVESPWDGDAISLTETGSTGYYSADVSDPVDRYAVFQQSGASPDVSDVPAIGAIALPVQFWNTDQGDVDNVNSIGKLVLDKLALLTSSSVVQVINLIEPGGVIELFKGSQNKASTGNAIQFDVPVGDFGDMTGVTPKMGLKKQVDTAGDDTAEVSGTVANAGTASQRFVFEFEVSDTSNLAVNRLPINQLSSTNSGRAYRYTVDTSDGGGECATYFKGEVSVSERLSSC